MSEWKGNASSTTARENRDLAVALALHVAPKEYAEANGLSYDGFVLVESGGCSFETKARHI